MLNLETEQRILVTALDGLTTFQKLQANSHLKANCPSGVSELACKIRQGTGRGCHLNTVGVCTGALPLHQNQSSIGATPPIKSGWVSWLCCTLSKGDQNLLIKHALNLLQRGCTNIECCPTCCNEQRRQNYCYTPINVHVFIDLTQLLKFFERFSFFYF